MTQATSSAFRILIVIVGAMLTGCYQLGQWVFADAYGRQFIGRPIDQEIEKLGPPLRIEATNRGTEYYVYPYRFDRPSVCTIYWEVSDGLIVDMKHEGRGCVKGPFND